MYLFVYGRGLYEDHHIKNVFAPHYTIFHNYHKIIFSEQCLAQNSQGAGIYIFFLGGGGVDYTSYNINFSSSETLI